MVENRDYPFNKDVLESGVIGLASPKDRLAAYVVDAILLLPAVQLLQSPFKRWILESFVFNEGESVVWFRVVNLVIFVLAFIFYYTVMTAWGGQTLGKKFFSIKVISYQGNISLLSAFSRSLFILFEIICFGIPFLGMFSHALRRPMHDRIADTLVISLKSPVSFPSKKEKWKANTAALVLGGSAALSCLVYIFMALSFNGSNSILSESKSSCTSEINSSDKTLNSGIELFIAGRISEKCLFKHARDFVWLAEESDLANLALALSYSEEEKKSKKYLQEICKYNETGTACLFSRWVLKAFPLDPSDPFIQKVSSGKVVKNFYKVYAASVYQNKGMHNETLAVLQKINGASHLQPYISLLSFNSLMKKRAWDEAYWVYHSTEYVDYHQVLDYLLKERNEDGLSSLQQLSLLEKFFPELMSESFEGRGLASSEVINEEVLEFYMRIKEEL